MALEGKSVAETRQPAQTPVLSSGELGAEIVIGGLPASAQSTPQ
jgi:hypothetical protein